MIAAGDPVRGRNPYTDEHIRGRVLDIKRSDLDGYDYARVSLDGGGVTLAAVSWLIGPRRCYRPTPREPWDGTCARCGRLIYVNGPYDSDRYTHNAARVAGRYR
jgi:hypothetical protein